MVNDKNIDFDCLNKYRTVKALFMRLNTKRSFRMFDERILSFVSDSRIRYSTCLTIQYFQRSIIG